MAGELTSLSSLYEATGEIDKAIELAEEIPDCHRKANSEPLAIRSQAELAMLYIKNSQVEKAKDCLKAIQIDDETIQKYFYPHGSHPYFCGVGAIRKICQMGNQNQ